MRCVEAPAYYAPPPRQPAVFLAGGITGVEDWQAQACRLLERLGDVAADALAALDELAA